MTTSTRLMKLADDKNHVVGTYFGRNFGGRVTESRQLNWVPDYPEQVTIILDEPLTVYGYTRNQLFINSRDVDDVSLGMTIEID